MKRLRNREGVALVVTVLVLMAVAAIAAAAATLSMNAQLANRSEQRQGVLESVAESGLELGRALLNGGVIELPDTGFVAIESDATVHDASGVAIPGVVRSIYAGPRGVIRGQYGVFASVVSVAETPGGHQVVRRADVKQESFSKFAYFTDTEPSYIAFGGGDQIFGPVHTNDILKIYSSGATFHGTVATARHVQGAAYAQFNKGYEEGVGRIEMPTTEDLDRLASLAAAGNMTFTAGSNPIDPGQASLRIEFVALDVNGDGDTTDDDEGFVMAYGSSDAEWVVADVPSSGLTNSPNCGHLHQPGDVWVGVLDHPSTGPDSRTAVLSNVGKRCYLGGDSTLFNGFRDSDSRGAWVAWPGSVHPELTARFGAKADYLFPMGRRFNPDFKGVIHVTGKVAVSGTLRGRVTLAATGNIVIADDIVYATDPSAPGRETTCDDLLGLFSANDVLMADNAINAPVRPTGAGNWFTYDDTKDEFIHGTILALDNFTVDAYADGATRAEPCEAQLWGRGCLYLNGGIIQQERGPVGTLGSPGGTGYLKRYSYDGCAATMPPPYFPTTGHFQRDRYFNVEPVGFDVAAYFELLAPGSQ